MSGPRRPRYFGIYDRGSRKAEKPVKATIGLAFCRLSVLDSPAEEERDLLQPQREIRKMREHLSETRRQEIFLALVDAQDHEMSVSQSRKLVAEQFGVTESEVRYIEREGLEMKWPPL